MDAYKVVLMASVEDDLRSIPRYDIASKLNKIANLAENPHPAGCEKLTGQNRYRLRLGKYRILYSIREEESLIRVYKVTRWKKSGANQ
jgi:mRNA interferase RelE/StbE